MPSVTVLMPVYNAEKHLAAAIESILQQTFTDFEFLIIDDGSTDNSATIVKSYLDSRIRFIQNEQNLGIQATLNKGLQLASAELIARMDADDISYPDRLLKQYTYLQQNPDCCLLGTRTRTINEAGKPLWIDENKSEHTYYNLTFFCAFYHSSVMYRKKNVIEAGMYKLPYAEDYELWCRLSRKYKINVLPEMLLDYRLTGNSTSNEIKKEEYNQAELSQIAENLKYFAGSNYKLPPSYLECFRYNYKPLLSEQSINSVLNCLKELDMLTKYILAKGNVNHNTAAIQDAARVKRSQIIKYFVKKLPVTKAIFLHARLMLGL